MKKESEKLRVEKEKYDTEYLGRKSRKKKRKKEKKESVFIEGKRKKEVNE